MSLMCTVALCITCLMLQPCLHYRTVSRDGRSCTTSLTTNISMADLHGAMNVEVYIRGHVNSFLILSNGRTRWTPPCSCPQQWSVVHLFYVSERSLKVFVLNVSSNRCTNYSSYILWTLGTVLYLGYNSFFLIKNRISKWNILYY